MTIKRIQIVELLLILAVLILLPATAAVAGKGKLLDQTGCACCPVCDHVCKLDAEETKVEHKCFKIETKVVCIPRVVFPWQKAKKSACAACDACDGNGCSACVHNGARVRKVCVAKPDSYECPACKYTWSVEKKDPCAGCPTMDFDPPAKPAVVKQRSPVQKPSNNITNIGRPEHRIAEAQEPWSSLQLEPVMVETFPAVESSSGSKGYQR